jgi:hypothetical protein
MDNLYLYENTVYPARTKAASQLQGDRMPRLTRTRQINRRALRDKTAGAAFGGRFYTCINYECRGKKAGHCKHLEEFRWPD